MKIWVDDLRPAPEGYKLSKSVNQTIKLVQENIDNIEELNLDHDLGDYAYDGGDAINILDWCV